MRVALLHNLAENAPQPNPDAPHDILYELDHPKNIEAYKQALEAGGHEVFAMDGDAYLAQRLKDLSIDICFNQFEGAGAGVDAGQVDDQARVDVPRSAHSAVPGICYRRRSARSPSGGPLP